MSFRILSKMLLKKASLGKVGNMQVFDVKFLKGSSPLPTDMRSDYKTI